ncbi:MAG: NAD(P)H-hydrate epimerase, partial [Thermomicrobiales bacterium]
MSSAHFPPEFALSPAAMASIDHLMQHRFGVSTLQLMELAGLAVARAACALLPNHEPRGASILILCGRGGNGGDGLVAARFLAAWGAHPSIVLSHSDDRLAPPTAHNLAAARALSLPISTWSPATPTLDLPASPSSEHSITPSPSNLTPALIIDALLGFGLSGPPTGPTASLIRLANAHPAPILAVDLPSGLDATTGHPWDPCIRATRTLTLALPKTGLLGPARPPLP